jgi:hypothetical protein
MKLRLLSTILFVSCALLSAVAQTGKVRGFVIDKGSDAPIPFANAVLEGTTIGAVANDEGYFILNNVPAGDYVLKVTFVGYNSYSKNIKVVNDRITSEKIYLEESSEVLDAVEINAGRQERETKVLTSVVSLNPKEIQQFSVGGDADIIKAMQVLPGVVTTGDQGGQLYIRGGAPIQNLILLDGMIIYNPFHSIGFFSVFDADIIQSAEVYTGGFNAEYGSRNSAVMDVRTRSANRKEFAGKVSASTYTAKVLLETPLGKKDERGQANTSFLVSAKTSYLDQTSSIFYPYVETEYEEGLPFNFTDIYAKLTSQSDNGSKINAFGFSFDDGVKFAGDNTIKWNSQGVGVDFTAVPSSSAALVGGGLSYSKYEIVSETPDGPSMSGISGFNGGLDFTYFLRKNDEFKYGLEAIGYSTDLKLQNEAGLTTTAANNSTEIAAYFQYKISQGRFLIQPGFRAHYFSSQGELSLEPRLGVKYSVNEWLRFKGSAGIYSQNLMASNSDRDVVNLFYGFLSGPENESSVYRQPGVDSKIQKAQHAVGGVEIELSKNLTVNVEAYVKNFEQIINVNRNKIYDANDTEAEEIYKRDFVGESGLARGIDFLATYRTNKVYLWGAYSYSRVTRNDGITEYFPYFDRRHNLNLVGTYAFGSDESWEVSIRYNFGTGFPFTPTRTNYSKLDFVTAGGEPDLTYDYTTENGEPDVLYGDLNTKRLPNYHRVDLSLKKVFELENKDRIEASVGATNMLNYDNIFYYDRNERKRVNQLPIMPTISLSYAF